MCLISCITKYRIQEAEYKFIPYNGNEILVFESSESEIDTISLKAYNGWSKTEKVPYRIFHNKYEKYGMELIRNNSNVSDSVPNFVIELKAFDWKGLRIKLRTKSDNPNYMNRTSFTVSEFDSIPTIEIQINGTIYSDVKVIFGEKHQNENQINQFYWSEKHGLLGWNNKTTKWRLRKKYVPQQRV